MHIIHPLWILSFTRHWMLPLADLIAPNFTQWFSSKFIHMTSEYIQSPVFHAWKSMAITQEAETKKPMTIWADVWQKLRNSPSKSKTSDKAKLIFKQSNVEVKISTDGESTALLSKLLWNWIFNYNFALNILV